jgi:bifunctional DNA-binding transcriptional regulator/antitoxin component of YhaV-PrlF toxin-antitoxin module
VGGTIDIEHNMVRKLVGVGRSLAVTLPKEVVEKFQLKKGDEVDVSVHPGTGAVTIDFGIRYYEDGKVTPRFREKAEEILREHEALFRELAKH